MTIIAGAYSRIAGVPLPHALCSELFPAVSREPGRARQVFRSPRCVVAKVDVGAYGVSAFQAHPGESVATLAGEALLGASRGRPRRTRADDLGLMHDLWKAGRGPVQLDCRGSFCAALYDAAGDRLVLTTDKLGMRPMYYWADDRFVVFGSALRILEAISIVPKSMDLRAVTEIASIGFPLGDRTAFTGIRTVQPGEGVEFSGSRTTRASYWQWDRLPAARLDENELAREAAERFCDAVARRLGGDSTTTALLSGGLDSRSIVAVLRQAGARVHTVTFSSFSGLLDPLLARNFADRAGTMHQEVSVDPTAETWYSQVLLQRPWTTAPAWHQYPPERPLAVWAGNGGSVGVGHLLMTDAICEHMRKGRREAAIRTYLDDEGARVLTYVLQRRVAAFASAVLVEGSAAELDAIGGDDPARAFHLFLMLNEQRRDFVKHYEDLDLHHIELLTPFFDSSFLEVVFAAPLDLCLRHAFYMKWLAHLPTVATGVAWQAYPGHAPCPLPLPEHLCDQWHPRWQGWSARRERRALLRRARQLLDADDFPDALLRRQRLRVAYYAYRAGLQDYGYLVRFADTFYQYWTRCGGRVSA